MRAEAMGGGVAADGRRAAADFAAWLLTDDALQIMFLVTILPSKPGLACLSGIGSF